MTKLLVTTDKTKFNLVLVRKLNVLGLNKEFVLAPNRLLRRA